MGLYVGVLGLQGAVSEHLRHFERCGVNAKVVRNCSDIKDLYGLVIPGGESTTIGLLMQKAGILDALKERHLAGMPIFGTCAGMVLAASSVVDGKGKQPLLGLMDITVKRNAFGRQKESFENRVKLSGWEKPFPGVFIRAPIILEYSGNLEVLASMDEGIIAARQNNVLVSSFHPELTADFSLHLFFLDMCNRFLHSQ